MTRGEKATGYFRGGYICSQAVLAAFSGDCGISEEQALRLGSCFGSGMRKGEVCGACSGALMVLGLMYGQDKAPDAEVRARTNALTEKFLESFSKECGSYICNELLGCDISTPQGAEYARSKKLFSDICPKLVGASAAILEQVITKAEDE